MRGLGFTALALDVAAPPLQCYGRTARTGEGQSGPTQFPFVPFREREMPNPWDIPAFPARGDDDQDATYAGVGRVLSQWEMIEVELSHIYAWLMNRPDDMEAVRRYGEGKGIFEERIKGLWVIADAYFRWNPHQETEGELCALSNTIGKFALRRNDVAHCIVRPFQWVVSPHFDGPLQFCAVPPHYAGKKFDPQDMPLFVFTSIELIALSNALFGVTQDAQKFKWRLMLGEDGVAPESS